MNTSLYNESIQNWWKARLAEFAEDGIRDANCGKYDPPHPNSDDPQDEDENAAYCRGFNQRRKELGKAFKLAGD